MGHINQPIYLDFNSTTLIDPKVRDAMLPFLAEHFGNPSNTYIYGLQARLTLEHARTQVAALLNAAPEEIVFTSGGSESDNFAIVGAALANASKGKHIITSSIEHPAVLNTCRYLEQRLGFTVTVVPVDNHGMVDPEEIRRAITGETILISVMHANNEVGTIEPVEKIGEIAHEAGVLFHTDAAQSSGKIEVDVKRMNVDLLTLAGHKMYAPKGIGALFIKKGTAIDALVHGAGQESNRRAGTENMPYIVGLGAACEIARHFLPLINRVRQLRDRLHQKIELGLGSGRVHLNGHPEHRLPNTLNISIQGTVGEELLNEIPEIAASTGAACHAGSTEPSSVLLEMGLSREQALGALRLSLGRWTTEKDVDTAADFIVERVKRLLEI
jgi:cysteine desulfurase